MDYLSPVSQKGAENVSDSNLHKENICVILSYKTIIRYERSVVNAGFI